MPVTRLNRTLVLVHGSILGLLYVLFFGPLVPELVNDWSTYSNFSYGFLVPFISGYLIWHNRAELRLLPMIPTLLGAIPLSLAISLALVGNAVGDVFTMRVSMVFALGCCIYLLLGNHFLKGLFFPIVYLTTMIPLPYVVIKELSDQLRHFDSVYSESLLRLIGVPVFRDSYFLHLHNITLEVADACSGVASIFALFALALVYGYFLPISWGGRLLIFASAVPFSIFANLFRIVVTAVLTYHFGPGVLKSLFHYLYGTFNFLIGVSLVVLLGEYLRNRNLEDHPRQLSHSQELGRTFGSGGVMNGWNSFTLGALIFGIAFWFSGNIYARPGTFVEMNFEQLSSSLASSFSISKLPWADPYEDPKADTSIATVYVGPEQLPIELFVGYRATQNGGDRLQSPKLVFPGGWNSVWVKPAQIELDGIGRIKASWMLTRKGDSQRLVLYWYQNRDVSIGEEVKYRVELFKKNILGGPTNGTVARIATPVRDEADVEQAQHRLKSFASQLYPRLVKVLHRTEDER